jgi:hypothetical protein
MKSRSPKRIAALIVVTLLCAGWWWMSWDFSDKFVAGRYVAKASGERNVLVLRSDHSFTQEVWKGDRTTLNASGSWRRFGEAGIAFSTNFLGASPVAVNDNNVYAMLDNNFGFWTLTLDPKYNDSLKFHKMWFL